MMPTKVLGFLLVVLSLFLVPVAAQEPELEPSDAPALEGVSESVLSTLSPDGLRVKNEGAVVAEFWFRKELRLNEDAHADLGVEFAKLGVGSLIGVVHFSGNWSDYKAGPVSSGTYTLRYVVQPADGEHMGVSLYRDFLALIPSADDTDSEKSFDHETLVDMSNKASGKDHPAILSVFPVYEEVSEPQMLKNEMDQWTMAVPLGEVTLGLVIVGHGETEGL